MNGGTAVPSVNTSKASNISNTKMIGESQNCLRSSKNAQSSARNVPTVTLPSRVLLLPGALCDDSARTSRPPSQNGKNRFSGQLMPGRGPVKIVLKVQR